MAWMVGIVQLLCVCGHCVAIVCVLCGHCMMMGIVWVVGDASIVLGIW